MSSADRTPSRRRAALAALLVAALVGGGTAAAVAASGDDDPAATASSVRPDDRDRDDADDADDTAEGGEGGEAAAAAAPKTDVRAAVAAALAKAKGVVASAELDEDGDRPVWEIEVVGKDGTRTEVLVDPDDGTVHGSDRAEDDDDSDDRDEAAALRKAGTDAAAAAGAALKEVPGSVLSVDFEDGRDDDRNDAPAWEVEVIGKDGTEREVLVDAGNGKAALGEADDRDDRDDDRRASDDTDGTDGTDGTDSKGDDAGDRRED
jgi:uncharacterized membrane protein YkoI